MSSGRIGYIVAVGIAALATIIALILNIESPEEKASEVRRAFRELNLPMALSNAQLQLQNDQLAKDKGLRLPDGSKVTPTRIAIDKFAISQAELAVETGQKLDRYLSESSNTKERSEYLRWDTLLDDADAPVKKGANPRRPWMTPSRPAPPTRP